jgi:hypothetical protein
MHKLAVMVSSILVSLGLASLLPAQPPGDGGPIPKAKGKEKAKAKKTGERAPGGDMRKAYELLRRLRADDGSAGRPEERLREWTDQAASLYREGLKAQAVADMFRAREYGTAAHDLARAVDHARNATRFDRPDPDLPPPSDDFGLEDARDRGRRDLTRAYERLEWLGTWRTAPGSEVYIKAARDLYSAARRDLVAGRDERAGELARAAEAMTHVPEHLAQVGADRDRPRDLPSPPPLDRPEPKAKKGEPRDFEPKAKKGEPRDFEPKAKKDEPRDRRDGELPPILPPG